MAEGYPDSLAGWGAPAIFKEAGRLLGKYFRLLHPFIAAFFLPVVVIELLQLWGFAWGISHHPHPHPHPHPHHHHHHHHHHHPHHPFWGFYRAFYIHHSHEGGGPGFNENLYAPAPSPHPHPPHPHPPHPHPPLLPLLIFAAIAIVLWLLTSFAIASISKAIAHIYSQDSHQDPSSSVTKSIFQSLPSSLYRIFITTLVILLFTFVGVLLVSFPLHLLNFFFHTKVLVIINHVFVDIVLLILAFVFLLALEVAVLEPDNYGLAALRRSWKLVRSKLGPSLIFFLVNIVLGGVLSKLAKAVILLPATGKLPFWTVYVLGVVWALIYLAFTVYFLVVAVVLYFSTKLKVESEGEYLPVNTREEYTPPVPSEN